jgi:ubiquinone/menaquinone biosynthesis C-methylase UbiE
MKVRESGMPSEKLWEEFFEPEKILRILKLNHKVVDVAEIGCGHGTFTIPALKAIKGTVYAIDIEEEMTKRVA